MHGGDANGVSMYITLSALRGGHPGNTVLPGARADCARRLGKESAHVSGTTAGAPSRALARDASDATMDATCGRVDCQLG